MPGGENHLNQTALEHLLVTQSHLKLFVACVTELSTLTVENKHRLPLAEGFPTILEGRRIGGDTIELFVTFLMKRGIRKNANVF